MGKCRILKLRRNARKVKNKSIEKNQHDTLKQLREENLQGFSSCVFFIFFSFPFFLICNLIMPLLIIFVLPRLAL